MLKLNYNFRYQVPNVFYDAEDGDVKHLKLKLLKTEPALLSWVEFDAEKQILLALYVIKTILYAKFRGAIRLKILGRL